MKKNKNIENEALVTDALLKLCNIKKDYVLNKNVVHALKGVSVSFRKSEFVSILGPSGCGKTTLLNIIGGLDKYTTGDLIIDGRSTSNYSDKDWDIYRNHRIGFIFQSYNLIPHQNILQNVELALTISGMSKEERISKAKDALDKVGLKDMYNKKPNQLSGGQCQRVAIARALVNEPEILLADEPTGALDSKTSEQIMELIAKIAKERLVIMVTHNPDIANRYSTRIINLLDGNILDDSNPYDDKIENKKVSIINNEKAKMSFTTAFKLSAKNLLSKFKRTILVCIAGSIGIVGVSTVLAVSSGVHDYIDSMQDDMLSGNPITITETAYDMKALMSETTMSEQIQALIEDGKINVNSLIDYLVKQSNKLNSYTIKNNLTKEYIDYVKAMPIENYSDITLDYGIDLAHNVYTPWKYDDSSISENMSIGAITKMYTSVLKKTDFGQFSSYISQLDVAMRQAPSNQEYILKQYDVLAGNLATSEDEIMVVVNKNSQLTDIILAQLGYYTQKEFINLVYKATNDNKYDKEDDKTIFDYEEILSETSNKTFSFYPNDVVFEENKGLTAQNNPFTYKPYVNDTFKDKLDLKVVGILRPKENINYGCLQAGFYYTEGLTNRIINANKDSKIINYYKDKKVEEITSGPALNPMGGDPIPSGVTYKYHYYFDDIRYDDELGYLGQESQMSTLMNFIQGITGDTGKPDQTFYSVSLRNLGGSDLANKISIYPVSFDNKNLVTSYLDKWNEDGDITYNDITINKENREDITYTDNLELVINMINTMIDIVTYALIVFTALSLLVSTVMIGIITYVSVVERKKEIGVIRALGGRKKDVSYLFIAETIIIGLASGILGILITLGIQGIINLAVGHIVNIYTIANLRLSQALIMILVSCILTLISGLIPAKAAANKNPVEALRDE